MSRPLAVVFLSLAACAPARPELQPFERAAGAAALQAWRASGLPEPNAGRCDVSLFQVRLVSAPEVSALCQGTSADHAAGCTAYDSTSNLFAWREYPIVVISPTWKSEPGIIIHELMHAYWHCSEMPGETGEGNIQHKDSRVWSAAGGATSVQARALDLLSPSTP